MRVNFLRKMLSYDNGPNIGNRLIALLCALTLIVVMGIVVVYVLVLGSTTHANGEERQVDSSPKTQPLQRQALDDVLPHVPKGPAPGTPHEHVLVGFLKAKYGLTDGLPGNYYSYLPFGSQPHIPTIGLIPGAVAGMPLIVGGAALAPQAQPQTVEQYWRTHGSTVEVSVFIDSSKPGLSVLPTTEYRVQMTRTEVGGMHYQLSHPMFIHVTDLSEGPRISYAKGVPQ